MADLNHRALCGVALEALENHQEQTRPIFQTMATITLLRDALSQPAPEPPTDEELAATFYGNCRSTAEGLRAVWALPMGQANG